ncbi:hypothetical protein [Mucilaginibacter sp.]|uniref:hypothetical protein n=1 Tax=Mucilaginibacter sp. TaxID=1882438 RepID=UPI003D0C6C00
MKKILLALFITAATVFYAAAQSKVTPQLSFAFEAGLPTGQASSVYNAIFGGSVKAEFPVKTSQFSITATAGYSSFLVKTIYSGYITNGNYVPIELGGKYFFSKIGYVEGDAGTSINVNGNYTGTSTAFIYAPSVGVVAPTKNHKASVDLNIRYEGRVETGGTVSQIALRIAYRFGI